MKNKDIKLAIFDIDNTLIPRGEQVVSNSAYEAIKKLEEKGIEVMIATGRAVYFIQDDIFERIKPNYVVTINGACAYNQNRDIISYVPMNIDEVNAFIKYARDHNLGIAAKMKDDMHVYNDMDIYLNVYLQGNPNKHILKDYTHIEALQDGDELPMGLFMMGDESKIDSLQDDALDSYFSHAYPQAYDVYSKRAGKIYGIETVLDKLDLTWDNVIAFGDADNDIEMIQKSAIGVAMGNGIDSLKKEADFVTKDINDDGIYYALENFEFI